MGLMHFLTQGLRVIKDGSVTATQHSAWAEFASVRAEVL